MEIFNRTPAISEDTLQYNLYPSSSLSDKASVTTFAACIQAYTDTLLPGFIWHRDAFELKVVQNPDDGERWLLEGKMRVGDCVDDEWCTVWLLRKISAKWDLVVSVFDSDGEFLLIEAAEALPSWVRPTNSENRVWIYGSRLHLIPISHVSPPSRKRQRRTFPGTNDEDENFNGNTGDEDMDEFISAEEAITLVRDIITETLAPASVERIVWQRISGYPAAAQNHTHVTKAYIPSDIARSLSRYPLLVQKAIETFYTRDAIQLRVAHRMKRFPPDSSVLWAVKMTRTAYAQLMGQKFFPPKVFGQWKEIEGTTEWRQRDVGMKLAVGFEILYQESKGWRDTSNTSAEGIKSSIEARKDALRRTPEYIKYIENLMSADYFRGEIKGSILWDKLETKAAETFIEVRREDDAKRQSFATLVDTAVSENTLLATSTTEEDSDDWLNVDAGGFEAMLEQTMGSSNRKRTSDLPDVNMEGVEETPDLASEQAARLKALAEKVEDFVEGEGDLEGAKFDDEEFSDDLISEDESASDSDEEMSQSARQSAMDKLVPGLEPSDYGKMPPSFHTNSQRVAPVTVESEAEIRTEKVSLETQRPMRKPIIPRDHYDGVDSDDESDEDEPADDAESDEDRPQVVGDIEVDMDEEEDEFLEFSRQALGISDAQWNDIVQDRQRRGAFVPRSVATNISAQKTTSEKTISEKTNSQPPHGRAPAAGPRPNVNPNLDSFEAVMQALDAELARSRKSPQKPVPEPSSVNKGKGKAIVEDDDDDDVETAMDAELLASLEEEDIGDDENGETMDYNLIKNFLESFKSQAGLSGPVGNLAGRLQPNWKLPRDES